MLVIYGDPMGKQRPNVWNGHGVTPTKTVNYETLVKETWAIHKEHYEGPLRAEITAYYSIPKSASKKAKADMAAWRIRPCKKPDLDNVAKIILDALNGLAYHDDSQVVELEIKKCYTEATPRVEVELMEV